MDQISPQLSHIDQIEKRISRLPQFSNIQGINECLLQSNSDCTVVLDDVISSTPPNFKYEIIIESQRGTTISGSHIYSKESVIYPIDPPKFQTLWGDNLASLKLYPDPGLEWQWGWDQWHVLMIGDVDEEGWVYSNFRFGSKHWSGVGNVGKFVRRRIWIRLTKKMIETQQEDDDDEGIQRLIIGENIFLEKKSRLDPLMNLLNPSNAKTMVDSLIDHVSNKSTTPTRTTSPYPSRSPSLSHIEAPDLEKTISNTKSGSLLDDLINSIKTANIDRLKTQRVLDFLFTANISLLEQIENNNPFIENLINLFMFNESKLNFIGKFQLKLQEAQQPEDKNKKLEAILRLFKSKLRDEWK